MTTHYRRLKVKLTFSTKIKQKIMVNFSQLYENCDYKIRRPTKTLHITRLHKLICSESVYQVDWHALMFSTCRTVSDLNRQLSQWLLPILIVINPVISI